MIQSPDTIPKLLIQNARKYGDGKPAIREKEYGIWQSYSWAKYLEQVEAFSLGLSSLGFGRGDKLAIIGDNRPQLYFGMIATQALGGIPVPVYQDANASEIQFVIHHSDSIVVLAEDQEQVDKVLEMKEQLPAIRYIIYDDPKGLRSYSYDFLLSFYKVRELGQELARNKPGYFEEQVNIGQGDDLAIINYTSGTTGVPKGVMLTHQNLIVTGLNFIQIDHLSEKDELMAYLPMAWIGDTFFSQVLSFLTGATVNCPEDSSTVRQDFREIAPTMTFAPPRIWENMLSLTQVKIEDAGWLKRKLFQFFISLGMEVTGQQMERKPVSWVPQLLFKLGNYLVFGPLRDQLGLRRMKAATTGGAPLGPESLQFFRTIGVNLKQIYGLTECGAPATLQRTGEVKIDSVGTPLPGIEIKISQAGEVLIKSPGVFKGYYKNPEATADTLIDGWLATGDAGIVDPDGHLVIIDRAKDVSHLQDGSVFAPQYIENRLKFSAYIKEAVAVGHERPFVVSMINIDMEVVGNWAERKSIPYSGYVDLSQKPEIYDLIHKEVQRVNRNLNPALRIKKFVLLHKELDPDDAEITRTRKIRRRFIAEKYHDIITALYRNDLNEIKVRATVTYEDGRKSEMERSLLIREVTVNDSN